MRNKKDSKNAPFYTDFGGTIREQDGNIIYTAIRSYLNKTAHLCLASELETLTSSTEIEKKMKEYLAKASNEYEFIHGKKVQEMLQTFFYHTSHMVFEIIGESHVSFFYPLPYFKLENLNKAFAESERFADLSLHWISLKSIADPDFHQKYITAFDLQVIS